MSAPTKTLDVRPIPVREKHATIFRLFDELPSGGVLQIINDHDPMPLFYQFQVERPGGFDWTRVEGGPEVWKVNISKKA